MIQSYLKLALRSLLRYKMHSAISVLGLGIGFACFIIAFVFIAHEMSYDAFHNNTERIYRVRTDNIEKARNIRYSRATSPHSITPLLKRDFPEIEDIVRIKHGNRIRSIEPRIVYYQDKHFVEKEIYYADPNFFQMFSFYLIEGDAHTALEAPYSVVITEEMAVKYFGDDNPIGKTLQIKIGDKKDYLVTGVVKDLSSNTHFKFDFIASLRTFQLRRGFNDSGYYTYILLSDKTSPELLEQKFPEFLDRHKYTGRSKTWEKKLFLQSLQDIHLYSHFENELSPNRDVRYLYLLMGIALCMVLIVCVNYVNFSTFRFANRAKEVGLRKVFGSVRSQLIQQFSGETLVMTVLAFAVSLPLVECSLPYVSDFLGQELAFDRDLVTDYGLILLGAVVTIGLVSGLYPAFFLSRFDPIDTLGGNAKVGSTTVLLRKGLIVFQFALSIVLLITTLSLHTQLQFLKNYDLGFDAENLVAFSARMLRQSSIATYLQDPRVLSITASWGPPDLSIKTDRFITEESAIPLTIKTMDVDYAYLETMGLKLRAGRNFSEDIASDPTDAFIINEAAAEILGWKNPIGKKLERTSRPQLRSASSKVVGVVKDFHYASLYTSVEPLVIGLLWDVQDVLMMDYLTAKIHPEDIPGALAFLKTKTQELMADEPFQYYFLTDVFDRFYREEEKIFRLIGFFSTLSIAIICLGVLGLASFTVDQRVKEIGIRKVLGASSSSIVYLLMKDVLIWVGIANAIAWPIVYLTNQAWLQHFAYRIDFDVWAFFLGSLAQIVTVVFTIGLQTSRAVHVNPVDALRRE